MYVHNSHHTHSLHTKLNLIFTQIFETLLIDTKQFPVLLLEATNSNYGDYQINGIMAVAKFQKQNPVKLAQQVVELAKPQLINLIDVISVAGAGFINLTLSTNAIAEYILNNDVTKQLSPNNINVVVDMSAPNLAKEMHVGHLRSTIIGDAIALIHTHMGYNVIRQNHVGDWGTQFGMLVAYFIKNNIDFNNTNHTIITDLESYYRNAKLLFDTDVEFAKYARYCVFVLQNYQTEGEFGKEVYKYWQDFRNISIKHCNEIYQRLLVNLNNNDIVGESFYNDKLPHVIDRLKEEQLITLSEGALCVFFNNKNFLNTEIQDELLDSVLIVQKQDGAYLYATTDLAAIDYRVHNANINADKIIYVVDLRQSLHFKQIFTLAKKINFTSKNNQEVELYHCGFGTMMGQDGKPFKTRTGGVIKLSELIDEAVIRAKDIVTTRNPDWSKIDIDNLANSLAISSIKYADLSKNRNSDYIFSFDKMLSFEGNTAAYLLYAYTRIQGILNKLNIINIQEFMINYKKTSSLFITHVCERALILHLSKFYDTLNKIILDCQINHLCLYLYTLAGLFMQFYETCKIIDIEDMNIKNSRIIVLILTANTLKCGLNLLGIAVCNKM